MKNRFLTLFKCLPVSNCLIELKSVPLYFVYKVMPIVAAAVAPAAIITL